jgi:hypothetical protein
MTKSMMASTCSSIVGHFNGHGSPPVQYEAHCPMQHVQGYSGSHWMPALGDYLLCIAPWLPGQQANKQQSTNTPTKLAILMAMAMRRYVTARIAKWRRSRALLEATGRCLWASIMSDNIKGTRLQRFFYVFHHQNSRKRSWVNAKTPVFNRGMTYRTKEKGLIKVSI